MREQHPVCRVGSRATAHAQPAARGVPGEDGRSLILHFACAEFEELRHNAAAARDVHLRLVRNCTDRVNAVSGGDGAPAPAAPENEADALRAAQDLSLAYVQYMRFAHRNTVRWRRGAATGGRGK